MRIADLKTKHTIFLLNPRVLLQKAKEAAAPPVAVLS
jgi:hypothetical protein